MSSALTQLVATASCAAVAATGVTRYRNRGRRAAARARRQAKRVQAATPPPRSVVWVLDAEGQYWNRQEGERWRALIHAEAGQLAFWSDGEDWEDLVDDFGPVAWRMEHELPWAQSET